MEDGGRWRGAYPGSVAIFRWKCATRPARRNVDNNAAPKWRAATDEDEHYCSPRRYDKARENAHVEIQNANSVDLVETKRKSGKRRVVSDGDRVPCEAKPHS